MQEFPPLKITLPCVAHKHKSYYFCRSATMEFTNSQSQCCCRVRKFGRTREQQRKFLTYLEKMNKSLREFICEVGRFLLAIAIMLLFVFVDRLYYHYKINRLSKHETVKAYVFDKTGKDWKSIHYRFVVEGKEYYGESPCPRTLIYPDEGDSIEVYYDAEDPDLNLWSGCWQIKSLQFK